jgi:hypothetical protein
VDHYESALEAATAHGAIAVEAEQAAVAALGNPREANCRYRCVLLTAEEARMLRQGNWEAGVICSRSWTKWLLAALPIVMLTCATALLLKGDTATAWALFVGGLGVGLLFVVPFLPIYTRSRGRIFRYGKWVVLTSTLVLLFGQDALKWSWLIFSCLWPMVWIERTRVSIRRKLPVEKWPKQLYL